MAFTFEDIRIGITTALKGVGVANVAVGQLTMDNAANKALVQVLSEVPLAEHAGSLYTEAPLVLADCMADCPADKLVVLDVEVSPGKTVRKPLVEIHRIEKTGVPALAEYAWAPAGDKIKLRPTLAAGAVATLCYTKAPVPMSAAGDPFPASPTLYRAVTLAGAIICAEKIAGLDPDQARRLQSQYDAAVGVLNGVSDKHLLQAYAAQSARAGVTGAGGQG